MLFPEVPEVAYKSNKTWDILKLSALI